MTPMTCDTSATDGMKIFRMFICKYSIKVLVNWWQILSGTIMDYEILCKYTSSLYYILFVYMHSLLAV